MLSHKWTFSLQILIVMLVLGFVASSAIAAEFSTTLSVDDSMDVSFADGVQVEYGAPGGGPTETFTINISFGKVVNHDVVLAANADPSKDFADNDFQIIAYNKFGGTETPPVIADDEVNPGSPAPATRADGKNFTVDLSKPQAASGIVRVLVRIPKHVVEVADPRADLNDDGTRKVDGKNAAAELMIHFVDTDNGAPTVFSIWRADAVPLPVTAATADVYILLSEKPKAFTKDHVDITNATWGDPVALEAIPHDEDGADDQIGDPNGTPEQQAQAADNRLSTGRDPTLYPYLLTITPKYENKNDILVKVKAFEDMVLPTSFKYTPPTTEANYVEGRSKLTVKVGKEAPPDKTAGIVVYIGEDIIIPEDGYLVVAKSKGDSAVRDPGDAKKTPVATVRQPFALTYNLVEGGLPNLDVLLNNGGTIDIIGPKGLIISEVMWGSDASLDSPVNSQYIELRNVSGVEIKAAKETYKLVFYGAGAPLPDMSVAANNIQDRIGTVGANGYWSVASIGQSGRTGIDESPGDTVAVAPTQALISMQRGYEAATLIAGVASAEGTVLIGTTVSVASDGTMMSSWTASEAPGVNFDPNKVGIRIGSPGRAPVSYPTTPDPESDPTPVAEADDIAITEIMVDTSDGRLPQWIELTNISGEEKRLAGWSLIIMNTAADSAAVGSRVTIDLSGTLGIGGGEDKGGTLGKTLLLVAWDGRNSRNLEGNDRVVDVSDQVDETGRYTLISEMAFMLALMPPQETSVVTYGDTAGNLGAAEAWEIPSSDGARSSLIRREMLDDGMATMGTSANGWVLASDTSLVTGPATWYGSDEDAGTPGYDGGGPLPVELSHFRPARDKATGAVVITWSTQSELNNAGFFIKRSQQRDGQFEIINAAMIPGAGTSSEKQFYTYTDTTAQPNVVYYYQIEDVSLDGNRQTLTNGIRLKGHIGAAGKLTTTWGDLKTQE